MMIDWWEKCLNRKIVDLKAEVMGELKPMRMPSRCERDGDPNCEGLYLKRE
jgi:hypothetical protein